MNFNPLTIDPYTNALRNEVRAFIAEHHAFLNDGYIDSWSLCNPAFSRLLGEKGWIGTTWPTQYGGGGRTYLERYVIIEELLAAGAPVGAHWVADRQTGPLLLRFGTETQKAFFLPKIVRGECFFAIGMSEPDSGSDLASIRTKADQVAGGWQITGGKTWTSFAMTCRYMVFLCRTTPPAKEQTDRRSGMSQFIIDLESEGVTRRPIRNLAGEEHFCEIFLDNVFVPEDRLLGEKDLGWQQVMAELAYERSGPERFLSNFRLLTETIDFLRSSAAGESAAPVIGKLVAQLMVLRQMSLSVAGQLQAGKLPVDEASIVKDLGTTFEQNLAETLRGLLTIEPEIDAGDRLSQLLGKSILTAPSFSLRGGTREILRGILAKGLGLR